MSSENKNLTNSSSGTFKAVAAFAKTAKATPALKTPDEGVEAVEKP